MTYLYEVGSILSFDNWETKCTINACHGCLKKIPIVQLALSIKIYDAHTLGTSIPVL